MKINQIKQKIYKSLKIILSNESWLAFTLIGITFIFRLLVAMITFSEDNINSWADSKEYLWFAQQFAKGNFNPHWEVENHGLEVAPFIPSLITIFILLFDSPLWPFFIYNCIITSILVYVLYALGKHIFNSSVGFLISIWAMFYTDYFRFNIQLLKEPTVYLFLPLTILLMVLSVKNRERILYLVMSSVTFSILIHTDVRFLFFTPLFLMLFIIVKNTSLINRMKSILIWFVLCALFASPMIIRNYKVYGEIVLISPQTIQITKKFWKSNLDYYTLSLKDQVIHKQMLHEAKTLDPAFYEEKFYKFRFNEAIKDKDGKPPYRYGHYEKYLMAFIHYWQPVYFSSSYLFDGFRYQKWSIRHNISSLLFYGIFLPFYILGIVMVIRNKNNFGIFIASIPLAHCAMHVYVTLALERYRSSINFCIVLIALAYLVSQFEKLHKKNNSNFLQNSKKT